LAQLRDGLQIDISLDQMLRDFASIDKRAIQIAFDLCFQRLVVERDQSIHWPYRFVRAIAIRKNRELLKQLGHARHASEEQERRRAQQQARDDELRREQEGRAQHPQHHLPSDLESWVRFQAQFGSRVHSLGAATLRETLGTLATKLGAAFDGYVAQLKDTIPRILDRLSPRARSDPDALADAFLRLAYASPEASSSTMGVASSSSSCNNIGNLVRQAIAAIPRPHDGTTNVRP
ncbi:MAG: hypothetical protein ACF8LL_02500, partial [Phycisphaerales bacterium]